MTEHLDAMCARFNGAPFYEHMGLSARSDEAGTSRVTLRNSPELRQAYGGLHGGAILALADAAISIAIVTTLEDGEATATTELSLTFLSPAGEEDLEAHGEVTKKGRRMAFGRCTIYAGDRLVATGQGAWYVGRKDKIDKTALNE